MKCARSSETKRRQRLARNRRKNKEKKLLRKGLVKLIEEMKQENKCLSNKVQVEMAIKGSILQYGELQRKRLLD